MRFRLWWKIKTWECKMCFFDHSSAQISFWFSFCRKTYAWIPRKYDVLSNCFKIQQLQLSLFAAPEIHGGEKELKRQISTLQMVFCKQFVMLWIMEHSLLGKFTWFIDISLNMHMWSPLALNEVLIYLILTWLVLLLIWDYLIWVHFYGK